MKWNANNTLDEQKFLDHISFIKFHFLQVENLFLIELSNRNPKKFVYLKQNKHKQKQLSHKNSILALERGNTCGKHQFNVQLE